MSATVPVVWKEQSFWAYDVALCVLLKHVIDAASRLMEEADDDDSWLAECIERWRINVVVGANHCLYLNEDWTSAQLERVVSLFDAACTELAGRHAIEAVEIESWQVLDDHTIETRGAQRFSTVPIIELGRAITELLTGCLESAPPRSAWLFGSEDGRTTIGMRE